MLPHPATHPHQPITRKYMYPLLAPNFSLVMEIYPESDLELRLVDVLHAIIILFQPMLTNVRQKT